MVTPLPSGNSKISVQKLTVTYGNNPPSLRDVSFEIERNKILSIIGPANSGKTTLLKTLNRLIDVEKQAKVNGQIFIDGKDIYREIDAVSLRRRVGLIFALPLPLPMTVYENVVYGPKRKNNKKKKDLLPLVERCLRDAYLWDEVKDRLEESAMKLSGGQQQRLCIARALAVEPEVILFDEPCSALDPISTGKVEEAMLNLKKEYTIVLVTNNTKQAARVGDNTAFFLMGELVELGSTSTMFTAPRDKRTDDYISGRFG